MDMAKLSESDQSLLDHTQTVCIYVPMYVVCMFVSFYVCMYALV